MVFHCKYHAMFGLLLLIYLLPLIAIVVLLMKLVIWLVRNVFRLAFWLVCKFLTFLGKVLLFVFGLLMRNKESAKNYTNR